MSRRPLLAGRAALTLAALWVLVAPGAAWAGFAFEPEHPVIGQHNLVTVSDDAGAPLANTELVATYYPNAAIERTVVLGFTNAAGELGWRPHHAGLVTLSAEGAGSLTVGVRFDGLPVRGLIVFLIAGTLLFGGIFFGGRHIMRGDYVDPST